MPQILPELETILHSGALSYGKWGRKFEEILGNYIRNNSILTVNSYNSAMLIAIAAMDLKAGDEIIASPMSCLASNQPFATQGLKVKWADVDPSTGTLDPDSVNKKMSAKTKAIFHNHFCGYPGFIEEINQIGHDNNMFVVDDAIEAFGSQYKGNKIGNTGADITVFSFQTVRLPNTVDGGAIAFNNEKLFNKGILIRDYGIDRKNFRDDNSEINPLCDISQPGFGATLSEINSYIGILQMDNIDKLLHIQSSNAEKWCKYFIDSQKTYKLIKSPSDSNPNYWVYGILSENKSGTIKEFKNKGFYASGVHLPNNYYSLFGKQEELKGVNEFYSKFVALPCGWWTEISI